MTAGRAVLVMCSICFWIFAVVGGVRGYIARWDGLEELAVRYETVAVLWVLAAIMVTYPPLEKRR